MKLHTPSKINLYLGVYPTKDDRGYHRVDSVMAPLALCDELEMDFSSPDSRDFCLYYQPELSIAAEQTTVWRAVQFFFDEFKEELSIFLDALKLSIRSHIPEAAGLGGSSADAAGAVRLLCQKYGLSCKDSRVLKLARRVGADVSFFLQEEIALYRAAGDVLTERFSEASRLLAGWPLVLVMPEQAGISTLAAYEEYDRAADEPQALEPLCELLRSAGDFRADPQLFRKKIAGHIFNNLAFASERLLPEIVSQKSWLEAQKGVQTACLSGSGSCTFALCESKEAATEIVQRIQKEKRWRVWQTKIIGNWSEIC